MERIKLKITLSLAVLIPCVLYIAGIIAQFMININAWKVAGSDYATSLAQAFAMADPGYSDMFNGARGLAAGIVFGNGFSWCFAYLGGLPQLNARYICMRDEKNFKFGRVISVTYMQECLDRSDWVVVAVLPQASEKVIRSLRFRENHKVINVMFGESENDIRSWMNCSVEKIIHMTPGTFLATYSGPIIQCPPDNEAEEIFSHIGKMIVVNDRYHAAVLETYAGLFAPIFAVMDRVIDWAVQEECVPEKAVTEYVTNMFAAVCQEACAKNHREVHYMATVSTPGGINMQALALLQDNNAFSPWHEVLPPLLARTAAKISKEKTNRQ